MSFYQLAKPGIIYSNVMTAAAGFLFASRWQGRWWQLPALLVGNGLIIGSACVLNNYIDRSIDKKMKRTQSRALVTGAVSARAAMTYATCLAVAGFVVLWQTNVLTVLLGMLAVFGYVVLYGMAKRRTPHGTLVGTLPGAASLVAGYTAATNRLDLAAFCLFLIMVVWQMAHFYSIALYRLEDYRAAGLPVWPARYGARSTQHWIVAYVLLFLLANISLVALGRAGITYLIAMVLGSVWWLDRARRGFTAADTAAWGRGMFGRSLLALLLLSVALALGPLLP